jgi:copper(I)-binding protein
MHVVIRSIALSASLLFGVAHAQVSVQDAWVRATVPAQQATGAFMRLQAATDSKLVAASSPVARVVEVHEMTMQNDVMRMRQIPFLALPAGKGVSLDPGGYHLMLLGLKRQAKKGDVIPLSLVIEGKGGRRQTLAVTAVVRGLAAGALVQDRARINLKEDK